MTTLREVIEKAILRAHPVGSYFLTEEDRNPAEILGGGIWVKLEGRVLIGASATYGIGTEGGESVHILTESEVPSHTHTRGTMNITGDFECQGSTQNKDTSNGAFYVHQYGSVDGGFSATNDFPHRAGFDASRAWTGETSSFGGGQAHNNLPPYRACFIWRRTS